MLCDVIVLFLGYAICEKNPSVKPNNRQLCDLTRIYNYRDFPSKHLFLCHK